MLPFALMFLSLPSSLSQSNEKMSLGEDKNIKKLKINKNLFTASEWDLGREQNYTHVFNLPSYPGGLV